MKSIIIAIIGSYLGIVVLVYVFQRNLMYAPSHDVISPSAAGVAEMSAHRLVAGDGLVTTSWYAPPEDGDKPVVVIYHGNAGTIASRAFKARYFLDAGFGVLLVGYRGYADNPGSPNEDGLYMDGRAALGFLSEQGINPERWILYGESLGSAVAVQMALEKPPLGLILEAPFTSMGEAAGYHYPWLPARWLVKDQYKSSDKISSIDVALLVVHGEYDRTIPQSQGRSLFDLAKGPKRALWVDDANHNNLFEFGVGAEMVKWLSTLQP